MKNGQTSQHDESSPQPSLPTSSLGAGWGNSRCATQMNITETSDTLSIQTTLMGLDPDSLVVTIRGPYFIVEGTILYTGGRGRYARYVAELLNVREDYMDMTYLVTGELTLSLLKLDSNSFDGRNDGHSDGLRDNHHDGRSDGRSDGSSDGLRDNHHDGRSDGRSDGSSDGTHDGR